MQLRATPPAGGGVALSYRRLSHAAAHSGWGNMVQEVTSSGNDQPAAWGRGSTSLFRVLFMISSILWEDKQKQTQLPPGKRTAAALLNLRYLLPLQPFLLLLEVQQLSLLPLLLCLPLSSEESLLPLEQTSL